MKQEFKPKLYLFGPEYNPAVERIFGIENIEMMKLMPLAKYPDNNVEYLADLARYLYGWYDHVVIVSSYEIKHLTMLRLSALNYLVYELKTEEQQETLEEWYEDYETFLGWLDSANDFLSAQETLLSNSESMFDEDFHEALYNTNLNLVDMKDHFEEVYREGFKIAFENKFQVA